MTNLDLDNRGLPSTEGYYRYRNSEEDELIKVISVRRHPTGMLCCDARIYSAPPYKNTISESDFSVPVELTGIVFEGRLED
jgi:hypothetical protein